MKSWINLFLMILIGLSISNCGQSEYQKLVESELASGVRNDSIVFDIHFGDTKKKFFDTCWKLNREGILQPGPKNLMVEYNIKSEEGSDIKWLFYPIVDKDNLIKKMDMEFSYEGWAPFNEQYQPDKLLPVIKDTLEKWYPGNPFMEVPLEDKSYWAKVDGNRRITMRSDDKSAVQVVFVDMTHEENQ